MTVKELVEALARMIEDGHGDADVAHVNGVGKATNVCGWELVTASSYEPRRGAQQLPEKKVLKLHTTSKF